MNDINDILLDGEQVLWSGAPDSALMKPLAPYWRRKLTHFFWLLFFALIFLGLLELETRLDREGMMDNAVMVIAVAILIGTVFGALTFLDFKDSAVPHQYDLYAITDRRLIVMNTKRHSSNSAFKNSVCYLANNTSNKHRTLSVHIGYGENDCLLLHGLPDANLVEKMVAEKFSIKEEKK